MAISAGAAGIYSDDFAGSTFPETTPGWTKINETGGAAITRTGFNTVDARAELSIPSGTAYEMYGAKNGLCMEQTCTDSNFTIRAKLDSLPNTNGQELGIYIANSDNTLGILAGFFYDNSELRAWAATFLPTGVQHHSAVAAYTAPAWVQIQWVSATDTANYAWSDTGAFGGEQITDTEVFSMTPAVCGIYSANFNSGGIPAHVAKFDYLFEMSAVIGDEDAVTGDSRRIFIIT